MRSVADAAPPVPINVWRITDVTQPAATSQHGRVLATQLAVLLLGVFTRPNDVVIDVAADVALAGAASGGARRYRPVPDPAHLPSAAGPARLILLPWPFPSPAAPVAVLTACRRLLTADGRVTVALTPSPAPTPYVEHTRRLLPAAQHAGLDYLQHIVVTTATADAADAAHGQDVGLNLLVFGPRTSA